MSSMSGGGGYKGPAGSSTGKMQTGKNFKESIPEGYDVSRIQKMTPDQIKLLNQGMEHVGPESYLSRLAKGDQSQFAEMEAPAMRQFQEMTGGLASRFSGQGMGGRHGSGFHNTMNQSTQDFASQLQSKRMDLRNQAIRDLMSMSHSLMGERPFETSLAEKPMGAFQDIAGRFAAAVPGALASFAGSPGGASQAMDQFSQASPNAPGQGFSSIKGTPGGGTSGKYSFPTFMGG